MCSFEFHRFMFNFIEENTYLIWDTHTRDAAIVDCGAWQPEEQRAIADFIAAHKLHPVCALLTHAHFDHIFGLQFLYEAYGLRPRMHPLEHANYHMADEQTEIFLHRRLPCSTPALGEDLSEGEEIPIGSLTLKVIATPGHTKGGVCFLLNPQPDDSPSTAPLLFSGDTLFGSSCGRTDLPGGSWEDMEQSLHKLFTTLPPNTRVLPGHGEATTIEQEIAHWRLKANPFSV